jgi:hypothetical protein
LCGVSTEDSAKIYRIRPAGLGARGRPGFGCSPTLFLDFSGESTRLLRRIHQDFAEPSRILPARVGLGRMAMWLSMFRIRVLCGDSAELLRGIYRTLRLGCRGSTGLWRRVPSTASSECRGRYHGFMEVLPGFFRSFYQDSPGNLPAICGEFTGSWQPDPFGHST